jgi:hypothetical protein
VPRLRAHTSVCPIAAFLSFFQGNLSRQEFEIRRGALGGALVPDRSIRRISRLANLAISFPESLRAVTRGDRSGGAMSSYFQAAKQAAADASKRAADMSKKAADYSSKKAAAAAAMTQEMTLLKKKRPPGDERRDGNTPPDSPAGPTIGLDDLRDASRRCRARGRRSGCPDARRGFARGGDAIDRRRARERNQPTLAGRAVPGWPDGRPRAARHHERDARRQ